jgi:hypothetical protein
MGCTSGRWSERTGIGTWALPSEIGGEISSTTCKEVVQRAGGSCVMMAKFGSDIGRSVSHESHGKPEITQI